MTLHDRRAPSAHLVFGILIIAVGVLFTLDNLGLADASDYLRYWPVALIAIGLAKLFEAGARAGSALGGLLFTAAGTWLLLDNLEIITVRLIDFWPVLLVVIGAVIVWQGLRRPRSRSSAGGSVDDVVNAIAVLSGVNRGSGSPAFRGGELTAFMGGLEIDLRHAAIEGEAVIDVFAMWGGIEIRVPENWTVISRVTPIIGGFEDKSARPPQGQSAQRLVVRGLVVMGGIEVKN